MPMTKVFMVRADLCGHCFASANVYNPNFLRYFFFRLLQCRWAARNPNADQNQSHARGQGRKSEVAGDVDHGAGLAVADSRVRNIVDAGKNKTIVSDTLVVWCFSPDTYSLFFFLLRSWRFEDNRDPRTRGRYSRERQRSPPSRRSRDRSRDRGGRRRSRSTSNDRFGGRRNRSNWKKGPMSPEQPPPPMTGPNSFGMTQQQLYDPNVYNQSYPGNQMGYYYISIQRRVLWIQSFNINTIHFIVD